MNLNSKLAGKKKVLIVDDDSAMRDLIRDLIGQIAPDFEVKEAGDGMQALATILQESFDLLITDMIMPNLDGRGLIECLAKLPKDRNPKNLLVISGIIMGSVKKIGRSTFIPKPFGKKEIGEYLHSTFGTPVQTVEKATPRLMIDQERFTQFSDGVKLVLESICSTKVNSVSAIVPSGELITGDIAVLSSLNSSKFNAIQVIHMGKKTFLRLLERMLGETYPEINAESQDAAAEIANQVIGYAKSQPCLQDHDIHAAIHTVTTGNDLRVKHFSSDGKFVSQLDTDLGMITIEIATRRDHV